MDESFSIGRSKAKAKRSHESTKQLRPSSPTSGVNNIIECLGLQPKASRYMAIERFLTVLVFCEAPLYCPTAPTCRCSLPTDQAVGL